MITNQRNTDLVAKVVTIKTVTIGYLKKAKVT